MSPFTRQAQLTGLIGWLALTFLTAAIGSAASLSADTFYAQLVRPGWAPPGAVFGPVWTVLYALMGVAAWLVWRVRGIGPARVALGLFLLQLVANGLWSWLFFVWQQGGPALLNLLVLWLLIVATLIAFWRIQRLAALLLVPYLLWVTFAGFLNHAVWQLNPRLLG